MKTQYKTIDEYISTFPDDVRPVLEQMRQTIRKAAPQAVEAISYQMPTFKLNGENLVHFAAWKNHIGFYPTPSGTKAFQKELSPYKAAKGSAQFPLSEPIPFDLVEKIVTFRVKENLAEKQRYQRIGKEKTKMQKIIPNLWFDRQSEEAVKFYVSVFNNSRVGNITLAGKAGFEITGLREGTILTVEFEIEGHKFVAINGGPEFKFNPSISFLVACYSKDEVDAIWKKLSQGGKVLMELGAYPFSEWYGWTQDRYGLSWQVMFMGDVKLRQKITPTLMYVGEQAGKAETAINFYTSVFHNAKVGDIDRYGKGEEPDREGTVKHASFTLENQDFAAMDSAYKHEFSFTEAISLKVACKTQKEIDYYWEKLT
ncbi:MAG: VOC family protein, partial [Dehalococcoidales bacterium]|nr:VOC family protein [Dehalococcoidales bacterium]